MRLRDKKELVKFLQSQNLMSLATNADKTWIATVYYAVDKDLQFYFVSSPDSKHSKDIEKNNKVSCAIYDSHTLNSAKKVGVQLQGIATQVKGWEDTERALRMWHKAAPGAEEISVKSMKEGEVGSKVYKIKPSLIKFFNQKIYKDPSARVFKL